MGIDYICDACGFTSTEKNRAVYKCPVCGNQMRAANYQIDNSPSVGRLLIYGLLLVIVLPICLAFLGIIGIPVFIVIFFVVRHVIKNNTSNKAIRSTPTVSNMNKVYTCSSCKKSFKGQQPKCPHCGITLNYK